MKQSEFIAQLKNRGLASSNLFLVYFRVPENFFRDDSIGLNYSFTLDDLNGNPGIAETYMSLYCEEAQVPNTQILTGDNRLQSFVTKMPYQKEWGDLTLTFKCDTEMFQKKFFDKWLERIVKTWNGDLGYKVDYQTDIVITQYKKTLTGMRTSTSVETELTGELTPVYITTLTNAFPISLSDIQYSHNDKDSTVKVQVTFQFDKLFNAKIDGATYVNNDSAESVGEGQEVIYNDYSGADGIDVTPDQRIPVVGDIPPGVHSENRSVFGSKKFPKQNKYTIWPGVPDPMALAESIIRERMAKSKIPTQQILGIGRQIAQASRL